MAACVCILRGRHGEIVDEPEIRDVLRTYRVESLPAAANAFGWKYAWLDWDVPEERQLFEAHLQRTWLMVDVLPGPMTMVVERLRPQPMSRYGPLMARAPEDHGREEDLSLRYPQLPHHAIVVVSALARGFWYLDPYYPGRGQPLFMAREEFARVWTGQVIIPRSSPGAARPGCRPPGPRTPR